MGSGRGGARPRRGSSRPSRACSPGCGHNILAASAYTTRDGLAIDLFHVDPIAGGPDEQELERARIETAARGGSGRRGGGARAAAPARAAARAAHAAAHRTRRQRGLRLLLDHRRRGDGPAGAAARHRARSLRGAAPIVAVRASTRASRATDAFCVTTLDDHKLVDPEQQRRIEAAILGAIGQGGE